MYNTKLYLEFCRCLSRSFPHYLLVAMLKAWCNAWTTGRRMGSCKECPFCGHEGGSDIAHFAVCASILQGVRRIQPPVETAWVVSPCLDNFLGLGFQENHFRRQVLLVDMVHSAFTDSKHGGGGNAVLLIQARIRQATRRWRGYQSALYSELDD